MFLTLPRILPIEDYGNISNHALNNEQLWEAIAKDFEAAAAGLPATQVQVGRANQTAAYAYLAKVRLYQAYTQDENYNVTGIDQNAHATGSRCYKPCYRCKP